LTNRQTKLFLLHHSYSTLFSPLRIKNFFPFARPISVKFAFLASSTPHAVNPDLDIKIEDHVSKITDTLSIAREKHPGQRNSLEVLTDRYQITGYDRSYHGALIDSEILADVYLAMTGGQRDLGFDDNTSKEFQSKFSDEASNDLNLVKIQVSEEDVNQHENYLNSLKIDHGNN